MWCSLSEGKRLRLSFLCTISIKFEVYLQLCCSFRLLLPCRVCSPVSHWHSRKAQTKITLKVVKHRPLPSTDWPRAVIFFIKPETPNFFFFFDCFSLTGWSWPNERESANGSKADLVTACSRIPYTAKWPYAFWRTIFCVKYRGDTL